MTQRLFAISLMLASGFAASAFLPTSAQARKADACDLVLTCAQARQIEKCKFDADCHQRETHARNKRVWGIFK